MTHPSAKNPNLESCVARPAGASDLVFCLSEHRASCGYALPFGEAHFCRHPESHAIAARDTTPRDEPASGQ